MPKPLESNGRYSVWNQSARPLLKVNVEWPMVGFVTCVSDGFIGLWIGCGGQWQTLSSGVLMFCRQWSGRVTIYGYDACAV